MSVEAPTGAGPILLLSDIQPCSNYTGGVVLAQQCRLLQPGELAAFIVQNPLLKPEPYPELAWLPMEIARKPNELYAPTAWKAGRTAAALTETYHATVTRNRLVRRAVDFGRKHRVRAVWAVLEGQTITRMAAQVAHKLGVPLYSQIWDPLSWWLRAHHVDARNAARAEKSFKDTLTISRTAGAPSWVMAEHIAREHGIHSIPLIASYDSALARPPATGCRAEGEVVVGIAGQLYAEDAWGSFLTMLERNRWAVAGRQVRILYFGSSPPDAVPRQRFMYAGWRDTSEVIAGLAEGADVCYCPYPFSAELEETARLSFPSKAVLYMASGKPVFFHGPHHSSPATYFQGNHAAVVCSSLDPYLIHGSFRWLMNDARVFAHTASRGHDAFMKDFTLNNLKASLDEFLERAA